MIYYCKFESNIGDLFIASLNNKIIKISFGNDEENFLKFINKFKEETAYSISENEYAIKEINEYLKGNIKEFTIDIELYGTDFQKKVWKELMNIPYGETKTYKQVAENVNSPKACRAVGLANNKNNIPIIIPCHRVIGSNNKLVGYAGGLDIKIKLLEVEQK